MRRWTALALLGAGAGLLALPACGGKTDETTRAAGITPAGAVAFFSVNLAPSIEQQRNLQGLVKAFPGAAEEVQGDFEEARDDLLSEVAEEAGLDYAADVKPWLGNEVAVALLPLAEGESVAGGGDPPVVVMFETDDEAAATAALEKAAAEGNFDGQSRTIDDFLVIVSHDDEAVEGASLDQVEAAAADDGSGLAENDKFTSVVDDLAGDRLLLGWVDGPGLANLFAGEDDLTDGFLLGLPRGAGTGGPAAADLHAEESALVVRGVAMAPEEGTGGGEPALTAGLPAEILGALTLFDIGDGIRQAFSAFAGFGGGPDLDDLARQTGIDIERDVLSWMEGELVVVAGTVRAGQEFPDLAVVIEPTDRAKAEAGLDKLAGLLDGEGFSLERRNIAGASAYVVPVEIAEGIQPAMALFEDRFVLASTTGFLEALAADASPSFGDSEAYESVIGEGSRDGTSFQVVVRIDPIREAIEAALSPSERADYEQEAKANLAPLDTFGMVARRDGDRYRFEMRLTVD
jgi:hypothetical protein